jgi:hypothetical protein
MCPGPCQCFWPAPGTGSTWVWPAEPWRVQGWTDSSREAAARPRREQPVRRSRQQTQIYANPRPQMRWRGMTSGGVHPPGACGRLPGCSSACVASSKSRPCALRDALLAGLAQFPRLSEEGIRRALAADVRTVRSASLLGARRRPLSRPSQVKVLRVDVGRSGGQPREPRAVSPW